MQDDKSGKRDGKTTAYVSFALGAVTSVAANVAHTATRDIYEVSPGPVIAAAFAPMALLLVVEMLLRTRNVGGFLGFLRWSGAAVVAGVAAVVSYGHMVDLLQSYGESDLVSYILPLAVDGLMVVASVVLAAPAFRHEVDGTAVPARQTARPADGNEDNGNGTTGKPETATVPEDDDNRADEVPAVVPESVPVPKPRKTARQTAVTELAATADERADARAAWIAAKDDGVTLSGKALAGRFGKSERWGRSRVTEAKAELADRETVSV